MFSKFSANIFVLWRIERTRKRLIATTRFLLPDNASNRRINAATLPDRALLFSFPLRLTFECDVFTQLQDIVGGNENDLKFKEGESWRRMFFRLLSIRFSLRSTTITVECRNLDRQTLAFQLKAFPFHNKSQLEMPWWCGWEKQTIELKAFRCRATVWSLNAIDVEGFLGEEGRGICVKAKEEVKVDGREGMMRRWELRSKEEFGRFEASLNFIWFSGRTASDVEWGNSWKQLENSSVARKASVCSRKIASLLSIQSLERKQVGKTTGREV
jgi:hypothetical protein